MLLVSCHFRTTHHRDSATQPPANLRLQSTSTTVNRGARHTRGRHVSRSLSRETPTDTPRCPACAIQAREPSRSPQRASLTHTALALRSCVMSLPSLFLRPAARFANDAHAAATRGCTKERARPQNKSETEQMGEQCTDQRITFEHTHGE